MISFGEDKYKPSLKALWKLCFPMDTDIFIDFYFDEVYKNDETLVYLENKTPAAAFQMIPYSLKNNAEIFRAGYISGAMTHPDFRQKGLMKELLLASFDIMRERGLDYTFLIPQEEWLFDFYGKFGYKILEKLKNCRCRRSGTKICNPLIIDSESYERCRVKQCHVDWSGNSAMTDLANIYSHFLSEIPQVVLKTEKQFNRILHDFFDENGVLFACEQGIAFTQKEESRIVVKEFFYQNQKIKEIFLKVIRNYYSQEKITILSSPEHLTGFQGMIKRLNNDRPEISSLYINMMLAD